MLKIRVTPPVGPCKDLNFTEQTVDFYRAFWAALSTVAKQFLNFCAEKGTIAFIVYYTVYYTFIVYYTVYCF